MSQTCTYNFSQGSRKKRERETISSTIKRGERIPHPLSADAHVDVASPHNAHTRLQVLDATMDGTATGTDYIQRFAALILSLHFS